MNILLEGLYSSALKLLESLSPDETYATLVVEAKKLVNAKYGSIFLNDNEKLRRVYSSIPSEYQVEPRRRGYTYQVFTKQKPMVVSTKTLEKFHPEFQDRDIKYLILIPLSFNQKSLGVLSLHSAQRYRFSAKQLQTLKIFGSFASLTLRNTQLYADATTALQTKGLFLSMASHELKTPLTTISGYAQLLSRNIKQQKPVRPEWVEIMKTQATRLTRLINELLEVNELRVGSFAPNWSFVTVPDFTNDLFSHFQNNYPHAVLRFKNDSTCDEALLMVDKERIIKVGFNIIDNAVKFSAPTASIDIKTFCQKNVWCLKITDHGKGLTAEDRAHVFEEFYKGKDHTFAGMGLGLYISKRIMEAHHGSIEINTLKAGGTQVVISLPLIIS